MIKRTILSTVLLFLSFNMVHAEDFTKVEAQVKKDLIKAEESYARTAEDIKAEREKLLKKIAELEEIRNQRRNDLILIENDLNDVKNAKDDLADENRELAGNLTEINAVFREFSRDLLSLIERSPVVAEKTENVKRLNDYLKGANPFGVEDIETLMDIAFSDMAVSGLVEKRRGPVVSRSGEEIESEIVRLGHFTAFYNNSDKTGFLTPSPASGRLLAAAEPSWYVGKKIDDYMAGESDTVFMDITGGGAITQLSRRTTFWEKIESGGLLIWPIILVGVIAALLIAERLLFLSRVRQNTDELMTSVIKMVDDGEFEGAMEKAGEQRGRPTSNVLLAGLAYRGRPQEIIDTGLTEAILKEVPRLERFLPALKVLAAIAPLLGLLGTVTGMINTFHVITLHGAGDPRLMAGGISEALVTTQFGLAVAIPIMVAAALLSRKVQNLTVDMEEKSLALTAALLKQQES